MVIVSMKEFLYVLPLQIYLKGKGPYHRPVKLSLDLQHSKTRFIQDLDLSKARFIQDLDLS